MKFGDGALAYALSLSSIVPPDRPPPTPMARDDLSAVWPDVIESSVAIFRDDTDPSPAGAPAIMQRRVTWSELFILCQVYYTGV